MNQLSTTKTKLGMNNYIVLGSYPLKFINIVKCCCPWKAICYMAVFVFLSIPPAQAQSIENIVLRLRNAYSFSQGYSPSRHTYNDDFIKNAVTDPLSRKFIASVLKSISPTNIRQTSTEDGRRCPTIAVRLVPSTVTAFVYSLKRRNPLTGRTGVIQTVKKTINPFGRPQRGATCFPLPRASSKPVYGDDCEVEFSVPLPTNEAGAGESYTVQFDIIGSNNSVLRSQSKSIVIPRSAPLVVSIGDSFASGEGNPDKSGKAASDNTFAQKDCDDDATMMIMRGNKPDMTKHPQWLDKEFHRSLRSGPALAAYDLTKDWPFLMFLSFAKSGAEVFNTNEDSHIIKQLEEVKKVVGKHKIDALVISIGGNDVGFADNLTAMASSFRSNDLSEVKKKVRDGLQKLENIGYPGLDSKIRELGLTIGTIFITEYSGHLFTDRNGRPKEGCGVFKSLRFWRLSKPEAEAIEVLGNELNESVRKAANRLNWTFITGISSKFLRHGYCSGQSFYVGATESCETQGDFDGMMHPNKEGTNVYREAIYSSIRRVLSRQGGVVAGLSN